MADRFQAYGLLHVKTIEEEQRIIHGTASTPMPDRMGDVVEPLGITFAKSVPLLLYHDTKRPVGSVAFDPPTAKGLTFQASLPRVAEAGTLRDRIDEAWQSIKAGLLAGVSIGLRSLEDSFDRETGGMHFLKTEVLELSLVAIPANADATIAGIKALDLAASGPAPLPRPGASAISRAKGAPPMTIQEQITAFENTRAAKSARMVALMTTAADQSITLDEKQTEEYDGLAAEVTSVDAHLVRLRALEKTNLAAAIPIKGADNPAAASSLRAAGSSPVITVKANVEPGTAFVRYTQALLCTKGNAMAAAEYAKRWHDSTPEVETVLKAAVAAGTTTDAVWAGPLAPIRPLVNEFLALLRPATILGKVTGWRQVPFNISVPIQTGGGTYAWVGQGAPKPVGTLAFGTITLAITKCAGIIVITDELARNSTPAAEAVIRNDMVAGIAAFLDTSFVNAASAPVANVSPGGITNGITAITSAGTTPSNARTDFQALLNAMTTANISVEGAHLIMSQTNAAVLASALNPLGQPLFPLLGPTGGTAMGITVVASQSAGANVILIQPTTVLYADDGGVTIDASVEASVQMDTVLDSPPVATTSLTSLWQNNLVGLRAERYINWKRARNAGVQWTSQTYVLT